MKWKNIKLGRKFFIAFGAIVTVLTVVALWSVFGINGIINNAGQVIEGNKIRTDLEHKYVQHLLWAQEVNDLLTNNEVTELQVEIDHTKCGFGEWYYGEGRKQAEELAPGLAPILAKMAVPHEHLHGSAQKIDDTFVPADRILSNSLREAKSDHLIFAHRLKDVVVENERIDKLAVEKDPTQCKFGKWLYSDETKKMMRENPEFAAICKAVELPHNKLHEEVVGMEALYKAGNFYEGKNLYMNVLKPTTYEVLDEIDRLVSWNDDRLATLDKAMDIYQNETMTNLTELGGLFNEVIEQSEYEIMTDEVMLAEANKTQGGVVIFSIIAIALAISLAVIITRGIVRPINKGVAFATLVSKGDLTAKIDIDQEDEIGLLASSLASMVEKLREVVSSIITGADSIAVASQQMSSTSQEMSQGATEQASSAEEVSSSMEEMASNIQQNTDNSQQTEKIALQATAGIKKGSDSTDISAKSMKQIAEKITIINDIAFQTNILALNAAVEAARAGEHGKGFAVVAAEVRKLAERSKIAADEIDELSKSGVAISEQAGQQLKEIVPEIEKTSKLLQEITAASLEQNSGADQINTAIQQLNQITQQNAAASEEMATSSEELSSQADQLKEIVSYFYIGDDRNISSFTSDKKELKNAATKKAAYTPNKDTKKNTEKAGVQFSMTDSDDKDKDFSKF